jgi:hypothetical protein
VTSRENDFLKGKLRFVLLPALALLCAATPASGQSLFGNILGTVMDKSEAVVPRASAIWIRTPCE